MDDLIPEDDLKPDTSDRRPQRSRKPPSSVPKLAVSRQYLMIAVGIIVLLLLILGIGSALKAPSQQGVGSASKAAKDINLSGASGDTTPGTPVTPAQTTPAQTASQPAAGAAVQPDANGVAGQQPKSIGLPAISPTPTQAQPQADSGQKERVDLPGDMTDALSQQQGQVNAVAQGEVNAASQSLTSLPTAPATVDSSLKPRASATPRPARPAAVHRAPEKAAVVEHRPEHRAEPAPAKVMHAPVTQLVAPAHKPAAPVAPPVKEVKKEAVHLAPSTPIVVHTPAPAATKPVAESSSAASLKSAPGSHFTLQLSSASQATGLNTYAHEQGLKNYQVYQTTRDGKPWFVLVSGNYATSADAKNAIASLPADVQAKKPWVKPVHQVQQDLKK
ncbi:MAG: SPOR domain-containing protein [Rouxiella aceris]|uniref:SPOR domain-containing protein n=1 Tax=Rouxiella aceris TaxID=2703884 RepID=UPI00284E5A4B|nr:SPOR domain-containing protein [Rouxiella aceris]MDR3430490.1 SPOR domain-containing protein [Rouxiella aceris]